MPQSSALLFPTGRLAPRPFLFAVIAVYLAGAASQLLTTPAIFARAGIWPFAIVQVALIWIWISLHANRLREAGHTAGLAVGVGLLYALSVVLLVVVATAFVKGAAAGSTDANAASALGLILLVAIVAILRSSASYDFTWLVVMALTAMTFAPVGIALFFSLWTATRRSRPKIAGGAA